MKFSGLGRGPTGPSPEDLEREAAAELRRAIGGAGEPRTRYPGYGMPSDWIAADGDAEADDERPRSTAADDERRAATDLAMQQLTERPQGRIRPQDTLVVPMPSTEAEDMRNRALEAAVERQRRMAAKKASAGPPQARSQDVHGAQSRVQRTSGANISPFLSVKPTLSGHRAPPSDAVPLGQPIPDAGAPEPATAIPVAAQPPGATDPELSELENLLTGQEPPDAFPAAARWLAEEVDASAALVLVTDGIVDDFTAWPPTSAVARELKGVIDQPMDPASSLRTAMAENRSLSQGDGVLVMPDGLEAEGCDWLIVPVTWDSDAVGVVFLTREEGRGFSEATTKLVESVARRLARALVLGEEPSASGEPDAVAVGGDQRHDVGEDHRAAGDDSAELSDALRAAMERLTPRPTEVSLPIERPDEEPSAAVRDRLLALRVLLEVVESSPPSSSRAYQEIVRGAGTLRDQITAFLVLPDGASENGRGDSHPSNRGRSS